MTVATCSWKCGGVIDTAKSNFCTVCGRDACRTYCAASDEEPRFGYHDPDRCTLRTGEIAGGADSWGCAKISGHTTGRGGRYCSTHLDCGYRSPDGTICGNYPGHDGGIHECVHSEGKQ